MQSITNQITIKKITLSNKKYFENFFEFLFYFFACFPYIKFIPLPIQTDTQVFCLLVAFIYCIIFGNILKINKKLLIIIITALLSCAVGAISGLTITAFRGIANYVSLALIGTVSMNFFLKNGSPEKYFKIFIWIWFIVGIIQLFIDRNFLNIIVSRGSTSPDRGVIGLASEPSFYGITMSLMLFFVKDFKKNKYLYMVLIAIQVVIIAQSMMGIIFFIGIYLMIFLGDIKKTVKSNTILFFVLIFAILITILLITVFPSARASGLIKKFINGTIFEDASVVGRFNAIEESLNEFVNNYFLPGGIHLRIMSGFGGMLVELGIFAIPLIVVVCKSVANVFKYKTFELLIIVIFILLMFTAIQPAHPLLACIVGYGLAKSENKKCIIN